MSFSLGLVVGKFWPPHRGHQLLLETAAAQVAELLVLVYANPDDTRHPAPTRAAWLGELYRGDDFAQGPHVGATPLRIVALTAAADALPPDTAADHTHREFVRQWLASHGYRPDVVFSSEAYGPGFAAHLGATHVLVDKPRQQVPVSGTGLRAALAADAAYYHLLDSRYLHPFIAAQYGAVPPTTVPRLVLLGAESSGKTTLVTALAEALGTVWVPEYGRTLHEQKNGALDFEDLLYIGRRQLELEDAATPQASGWLVCDTNAATTALYSYYYFHRCDPTLQVLARVCGQRYAHTFVCLPTVPFEQDGWRGPEALRQFQHGAILMQLQLLGIPYTLLNGSVEERVAQVREALVANNVRHKIEEARERWQSQLTAYNFPTTIKALNFGVQEVTQAYEFYLEGFTWYDEASELRLLNVAWQPNGNYVSMEKKLVPWDLVTTLNFYRKLLDELWQSKALLIPDSVEVVTVSLPNGPPIRIN